MFIDTFDMGQSLQIYESHEFRLESVKSKLWTNK